MMHSIPVNVKVIAPIFAFIMALTVIFVRIKAADKPTNAKNTHSTAWNEHRFFNVPVPACAYPLVLGHRIFLGRGSFLSIPLIQTSKYEIIDGQVYLKRSRAFIYILLILFVIRMSLHTYIEHFISYYQTASLFFILAFGMLLPWRIAMYIQYKNFCPQKKMHPENPCPKNLPDRGRFFCFIRLKFSNI